MRTMATALVVCLTAAALPAAEPPSIGARVRALGADGLEIKGTLTAYGAHDLTITTRRGRDATTIGLDRIEKLQVADGRDRGAGAVYGMIAGLAVAIGATVVYLKDAGAACSEGPCLLYFFFVAAASLPAGALVGGIAAAPTRWRDVSLPAAPPPARSGFGLAVAPARGGARFALTYGF